MNKKFNYILILSILFISCFSIKTEALEDQKTSVSALFLNRHSGKAYEPTIEVNTDQMRAMIEAARWTPSSHNDQPWNFIFCHRTLTPEAYLKVLETLKETQQAWVQDASLLVVAVARTKEIYKGKFNEWADYDTGAATMSLSLQATALGLMAHQIGGFNKAKVSEDFQLPIDHKPLVIIAIGHEAKEGAAETKPRTRRSIEENFFLGEWGRSFISPK
jgi:nitroreductase